MKKKLTTDDVDAEFGESPRYWYALLSMGIHNQRITEEIIQKILDFKEKHRTPAKQERQ